MSRLNVVGITRVRNEAHIIEDTLNHYAHICNQGIYVFDEASTDDTVQICANHPSVGESHMICWPEFVPNNRREFESWGRQMPLNLAREQGGFDWVLYFDADERIEINSQRLETKAGHGCNFFHWRLWDFYITPEDVNKHWSERQWIGPEYRDICMMAREVTNPLFKERELFPSMGSRNTFYAGDCKHYGKAISVEQWEEACVYYTTKQTEYFKKRWENRFGKAVHDGFSDFGRPLILWDTREAHGVKLEQ